MLKKTLLIGGSRFALAFCAGFALTGVDAASRADGKQQCGLPDQRDEQRTWRRCDHCCRRVGGVVRNQRDIGCMRRRGLRLTSPLQPLSARRSPKSQDAGVMVGGSTMNIRRYLPGR